MDKSQSIRITVEGDKRTLQELYPRAFPEEELRPLVEALLAWQDGVLSLMAEQDGACIGHIVLTRCDTTPDGQEGALLGPLAVAPEWQRQGWGSALIRVALDQLTKDGVRQVLVLGDPNYYGRLGFAEETSVLPPYPLPKDWGPAWQSQLLSDAAPLPAGGLHVLEPWRVPAYWSG